VDQQFALLVGVVGAEPVGLGVRRHVDPEQPQLAVVDPGVRVLEGDPALAE
jgi:hypothetical protein